MEISGMVRATLRGAAVSDSWQILRGEIRVRMPCGIRADIFGCPHGLHAFPVGDPPVAASRTRSAADQARGRLGVIHFQSKKCVAARSRRGALIAPSRCGRSAPHRARAVGSTGVPRSPMRSFRMKRTESRRTKAVPDFGRQESMARDDRPKSGIALQRHSANTRSG